MRKSSRYRLSRFTRVLINQPSGLTPLTIAARMLILAGLLWPVGGVGVRATVNSSAFFNARSASGSTIVAQSQVVLTSIGTAANKTSSTSTAITTTAGVALGNSIIVAFAMNPAAGTVACMDTAGNSYNVDVDIRNGSALTGVRTVIFSAHNVAPLGIGDTITITHPSVTAKAASAIEVTGLATAMTLDQTASAIGSSTTPSSGNTATTTQAQELLFGNIGVEGPVGDTFTKGALYSAAIGEAGTTGGLALDNITVDPEYGFVTATGTFAADGTLAPSRRWAAAIATYKVSRPTSVLLGSLRARSAGSQVQILWDTVSEIDVAGFNVLRSDGENRPYVQLNDSLIPAQVPGSVSGTHYVFTDAPVTRSGLYQYVLEAVLLDGSKEIFGPITVWVKRSVVDSQ